MSNTGTKRVRVVVSVEDVSEERRAALLGGLRAAGLDVDEFMDELGVVSGSIDKNSVAALRGVTGVLGVELDRTVRIPPPSSDTQ